MHSRGHLESIEQMASWEGPKARRSGFGPEQFVQSEHKPALVKLLRYSPLERVASQSVPRVEESCDLGVTNLD
jgi:hypothetical protein